jgi:hypothetical protein
MISVGTLVFLPLIREIPDPRPRVFGGLGTTHILRVNQLSSMTSERAGSTQINSPLVNRPHLQCSTLNRHQSYGYLVLRVSGVTGIELRQDAELRV